MENSRAFIYLMEQIDATGFQKMQGYYEKIMEEIYDWERDEVEDIIWHNFCNKKDYNLAIFLPKLSKYNGIEVLKTELKNLKVPSGGSVTLSQVLYNATNNITYLDIIKQNIDGEPDNISYVAIMSYCKPCKKVYDYLVDIYINNNNKTIRSTAVTGILYNKQIIKNPHDIKEMTDNLVLKRKFISDNKYEREKIIEEFESGKLE